MKIAIVHDHLTQIGGAERVLSNLHRLWPQAPIYTLVYDQEKMKDLFASGRIRTSFIQKMPGAPRHYQWYLPFMPAATESHDLSDFDVVISSSSAHAKGAITHTKTLHLCYCHTPTRYLWSDAHTYVDGLRFPRWFKNFIPLVLSRQRQWDQVAAQRVDVFLANSQFVAQRIRKYYKRESIVLYPPVETKKFKLAPQVEKYYLTGGRIVPYKRFDLVVRAFNRLGIPLKVFGDGPDLLKLKKMAGEHIRFVGRVSDQVLGDLYARATAFIHPQLEDFGITAVEAMAAGRPVIAYGAGGALETVVPGRSGTFFEEQSWEALADTVVRFKPDHFDPAQIKKYSEKFDSSVFNAELQKIVAREYKIFCSPLPK